LIAAVAQLAERVTCNHQVPGSNPGGGFSSASVSWTKHDIDEIIFQHEIVNRDKRYVNAMKRRLIRFSEWCSYSCNLNDIIIYINEIKSKYSFSELHKTILAIRMLMREINAPFADKIKLPKQPKRRKKIIKVQHIKQLLKLVEQLNHESMKLRTKAAILIAATSGVRAEELYKITADDIDLENRTIYLSAEITKDFEDRVTFFSEEAKAALIEYLNNVERRTPKLFSESNIKRAFQQLNTHLRVKHMRKFFSQQSDRLGMPTAIKKILMGHVVGDDEFVIPRGSDVDLSHYDFQDEEELKKIYDKYWKDFRILG